jgi:two-component sensor histidine kinase
MTIRPDLCHTEIVELALESHPVATLIVRPSGRVLYWNEAARLGFGEKKEANLIMEPMINDWKPPRRSLVEALETIAESSGWTPLRLMRGEEIRHLRARGLSPDAGGSAVLMTAAPEVSSAFVSHKLQIERLHGEIFRRQKVEEELRAAVETSKLLKRELVHRVKNNLAVMSALLRSEARALDDPNSSSVLVEAASRIMSISVVHELLDDNGEVDRIDVEDLIRELVLRIQATICPPKVAISINTRSALASSEAASTIALLVNELVTNAIKHAFVGRDGGLIEVRFEEAPSEHVLVVSDNGIGMPRVEMGTLKIPRIVKALASQVEAEIVCEVDCGTTWRLTIPSKAISPR